MVFLPKKEMAVSCQTKMKETHDLLITDIPGCETPEEKKLSPTKKRKRRKRRGTRSKRNPSPDEPKQNDSLPEVDAPGKGFKKVFDSEQLITVLCSKPKAKIKIKSDKCGRNLPAMKPCPGVSISKKNTGSDNSANSSSAKASSALVTKRRKCRRKRSKRNPSQDEPKQYSSLSELDAPDQGFRKVSDSEQLVTMLCPKPKANQKTKRDKCGRDVPALKPYPGVSISKKNTGSDNNSNSSSAKALSDLMSKRQKRRRKRSKRNPPQDEPKQNSSLTESDQLITMLCSKPKANQEIKPDKFGRDFLDLKPCPGVSVSKKNTGSDNSTNSSSAKALSDLMTVLESLPKSTGGCPSLKVKKTSVRGSSGAQETSISKMTIDDPISFADISGRSNLLNLLNFLPLKRPVYSRKKLLVLDINGILADIVYPAPKSYRPDHKIAGRAVFTRPFCSDFLDFCFERFDVAIWSSRSRKIIDKVVEYLMGDRKDKLLFCWDLSQCTDSNYKTLENKHKVMVFKELRKVWESNEPDVPWEIGCYNESNTILLDDSPYKALLNPRHTAIFPSSYHYADRADSALGPNGTIRAYLEEIAVADDVQKFIKRHPFGQKAITERSISWCFYNEVIKEQRAIPAGG